MITSPGFVDAHSHLRSTSLRQHGVVGSCLEEALLRMTAMTSVDVEDDVFVAASDLISAGVTGVQVVVHTFDDEAGYLNLVDAVVRGVTRSGIRALIILAITDQAEFVPVGVPASREWLDVTSPRRGLAAEAFTDVVQQVRSSYPDMAFGVGPVAPQWCSNALLEVLGALAEQGMRVHSHLLESHRQRTWTSPDPVTRLSDHNLLGPGTSLAHGVWCEPHDLERIASAGAQLVTCPESNALLGSGNADVLAWQRHGIAVGIGLDSAADDVQPWHVAREVFDPSGALMALTSGGVTCTDLECGSDEIWWRDEVGGQIERVVIAGVERMRSGTLVNADEVQDSRLRVAAKMTEDRVNREARQAALSAVMDAYLSGLENS